MLSVPRPRIIDDRQILKKAMLLFWAKGYRNVSTRDLEQATGLPTCSLNLRWKNKEGIFIAALKYYAEKIIDRRFQLYLQNEDGLEGIRLFLKSPYQDEKQPYHACLVVNTWSELGNEIPAVTKVLLNANKQIKKSLKEAVLRGIQQGTIRPDLDPDNLAEYLQSSFQGLLITIYSVRNRDQLNQLVEIILSTLINQTKE